MLQTVTTMIISLFHKNLSYCCIIVGSSSSRFFEKLAEIASFGEKIVCLSVLVFTVTTVTKCNCIYLTNEKSKNYRCYRLTKKPAYCNMSVTNCNRSVTGL